MAKEETDKIIKEFSTNYLSQYRWEKDRARNLSAEDFLAIRLDALTASLKKRHYSEVVIMADKAEKDGWNLDRFIKAMLGLIEIKL